MPSLLVDKLSELKHDRKRYVIFTSRIAAKILFVEKKIEIQEMFVASKNYLRKVRGMSELLDLTVEGNLQAFDCKVNNIETWERRGI